MSWASRAAKNVIPLSAEQFDLAKALREWRYTGEFHDLEAPIEVCQLCDHPEIRYQFEIGNQNTDHKLLVGSECINRFGIVASDDQGRALSESESRKKVGRDRRHLIEVARKKRIVTALVALAHADPDFNILNFLEYVQDRGAFTPSQMSLLVWRLRENDIEYRLTDFRITIRRNREKKQLIDMPVWKLTTILPCLSATQMVWIRNNRDDDWDG